MHQAWRYLKLFTKLIASKPCYENDTNVFYRARKKTSRIKLWAAFLFLNVLLPQIRKTVLRDLENLSNLMAFEKIRMPSENFCCRKLIRPWKSLAVTKVSKALRTVLVRCCKIPRQEITHEPHLTRIFIAPRWRKDYFPQPHVGLSPTQEVYSLCDNRVDRIYRPRFLKLSPN